MMDTEADNCFKIEKTDKRSVSSSEYEIIISPDDAGGAGSPPGILQQTLLSNILAGCDIAKTVKDGGLYKVVGEALQEAGDGTYSGVYRGTDGKITGHAKFEKNGIRGTRIAGQILSQCMLIHIAMELQYIKKDIKDIQEDLFLENVNDVISNIKTAETELKHFSQCSNNLENIRTDLYTSVNKLRLTIEKKLKRISPESRFWENWVTPKHSEIEKEMASFLHAFKVLLDGIKMTSYLYCLKNPEAGRDIIHNFFDDLKKIDYNKIYNCCRYLPYEADLGKIQTDFKTFPEKIEHFLEIEKKSPVLYIDADTLQKYSQNQISTDEENNG